MVVWSWSDLWAYIRTMPQRTQGQLAVQLDLERWLTSRSPRVQYDVLEHAPAPVIKSLQRGGVLKQEVIAKIESVDRKSAILHVTLQKRTGREGKNARQTHG